MGRHLALVGVSDEAMTELEKYGFDKIRSNGAALFDVIKKMGIVPNDARLDFYTRMPHQDALCLRVEHEKFPETTEFEQIRASVGITAEFVRVWQEPEKYAKRIIPATAGQLEALGEPTNDNSIVPAK